MKCCGFMALWLYGLKKGRAEMKILRELSIKNSRFDPDEGELISYINRLNVYYEKHGFFINIFKEENKKSTIQSRLLFPYLGYKLLLQDINDVELNTGNFYFYLTHKIYVIDGESSQLVGFRVCCVRFVNTTDYGGKEVEKVSQNFSLEEVESGKWFNNNLKNRGFKLPKKNIDKLMKQLIEMKIENSIAIFSRIGWNWHQNGLYYIPFSLGGKNEIILESDDLFEDFKVEYEAAMDDREAYKEIQQLLELTDKSIAIPLLSFSVLSSLISLIKKYSNEYPKFLLCLSGKQDGNKEEISNLLCSLYNRSKHIKRMDGTLHTNYKIKAKLLDEKVGKLRDAVFIGKIESEKDQYNYLKLINRDNSNLPPCGILLLSDNPIKQDSVLNINLAEVTIDRNILESHRSRPAIYTTWFKSFISYIQKSKDSSKWRVSKNGSIDKLYYESMNRIDDGDSDYDINLLRYHAWLLMGYTLFLRHGVNLQVISKKEYALLLNEVVSIFQNSCKVDSVNNESSKKPAPTIKDLAVVFLNAIDNIIKDEYLIGYDDDSKKTEQGRTNGEKLLLEKEKSFKIVEEYTKGKEIELHNNQSRGIYEYLYNNNILVTKTTEKKEKKTSGRYGVRVKQVWYNDYHIERAKKFLEENGCELVFFKK